MWVRVTFFWKNSSLVLKPERCWSSARVASVHPFRMPNQLDAHDSQTFTDPRTLRHADTNTHTYIHTKTNGKLPCTHISACPFQTRPECTRVRGSVNVSESCASSWLGMGNGCTEATRALEQHLSGFNTRELFFQKNVTRAHITFFGKNSFLLFKSMWCAHTTFGADGKWMQI